MRHATDICRLRSVGQLGTLGAPGADRVTVPCVYVADADLQALHRRITALCLCG